MTTGFDKQKIDGVAARYNEAAKAGGWSSQCDPSLTFFRPQLTDLLALWHEKAKDGIPARSIFDARSLKPVLSNMLIVERVQDGDEQRRWRFRYFGSELVKLLGEFTNQALEDALAPEHAARWGFLYDCVVEGTAPARIVTSYQLAKIDYRDGEGLIVPLANEQGHTSLVLSATYVRPKISP